MNVNVSVKPHLEYLGKKVKDRVTGIVGICTSVGFDLYGCVQAVVSPGLDKEGEPRKLHWFDLSRLEVIEHERIMAPPRFGWEFAPEAISAKGPEDKPIMGRDV